MTGKPYTPGPRQAIAERPHYTEAEVRAMRAAVLRQAHKHLKVYGPFEGLDDPEFDAGYSAGYHTAMKRLLAMIDQPDEDALNTVIGAAIRNLISEVEEIEVLAGTPSAKLGAESMRDIILDKLEAATTPDALAALEQVKLDALVRGFDLGFAASGEGWNGEYPSDVQDTDYYREARAEAIRGESE